MAESWSDPLQRWDPKSQELAYNNFTDRMKVELPAAGDPSASGALTMVTPYPVNKSATYTAAQTDTVIWTPVPGKRISLLGAMVSSSSCNTIEIESSNVDVVPPMYISASGGAVTSGFGELWRGSINATLTVTSLVNTNHSVMLWGYES